MCARRNGSRQCCGEWWRSQFALFAGFSENLIEAINIIGSIFYGVVLGIFLVAFFFKKVGGTAVFWAAVLAQMLIFAIFVLRHRFPLLDFSYLWYNLIGCLRRLCGTQCDIAGVSAQTSFRS